LMPCCCDWIASGAEFCEHRLCLFDHCPYILKYLLRFESKYQIEFENYRLWSNLKTFFYTCNNYDLALLLILIDLRLFWDNICRSVVLAE
jgi:hypothetical protein